MNRERIVQTLAVIALIVGAIYYYRTRAPNLEPLHFEAAEVRDGNLALRLTYAGSRIGKIDPADPGVDTRVQIYRCDRPDTVSRTPSFFKQVRVLDRGAKTQRRPYAVEVIVQDVPCEPQSRVFEGSNYVEGPDLDWTNACVSYIVSGRHPFEPTRIRASTAPGDLSAVAGFCAAMASPPAPAD